MISKINEDLKIFRDGAELELKVKKADNIIFEELEDASMVLFNETTQETHFLNEMASFMLKLCDGRVANYVFLDFKGHIDSDSGVSEEKLHSDFYKTIEDFVNKNVVKIIK